MNTAVKEKTAKRAKKAITKVIIETPKAKKSKKDTTYDNFQWYKNVLVWTLNPIKLD
jgi:hypothetical protein